MKKEGGKEDFAQVKSRREGEIRKLVASTSLILLLVTFFLVEDRRRCNAVALSSNLDSEVGTARGKIPFTVK